MRLSLASTGGCSDSGISSPRSKQWWLCIEDCVVCGSGSDGNTGSNFARWCHAPSQRRFPTEGGCIVRIGGDGDGVSVQWQKFYQLCLVEWNGSLRSYETSRTELSAHPPHPTSRPRLNVSTSSPSVPSPDESRHYPSPSISPVHRIVDQIISVSSFLVLLWITPR
ncbi:hypothetical protein Tco_1509587 [Tanacetum coccineum]